MKLKDHVTWTDSVVGAQVFDVNQSFTLTVLDPCKTTTIQHITTITNMTVVLGTSAEQAFSEVTDSASTTYGVGSCGSRTYRIVDANDATKTAVTFARVVVVTADNSYKIVTDSSTEADVGVHNLKVYITLNNYPLSSDLSHPTDLASDFSITINHATCDCTLLKWTLPAAQTLTTSVKKAVSDTLTIAIATVD